MVSYPKDQFDAVPTEVQRVGAHRAPARKGRGWIGFAWAVLATGVLVFAGLFGVSRFLGVDVGVPFFAAEATPTPTAIPTPTAEPLTDPATIDPARHISITVLNGTVMAGLEATVAADLTEAGWPVGSSTSASDNAIAETIVYYSDPANEDVARGLVGAIEAGQIRLVPAETFPGAPITLVLGADFPGATP